MAVRSALKRELEQLEKEDIIVKETEHTDWRPMPLKSTELPEYPFQIVSMDVFEVNCKGVTRKYLITVDHFSDFYELDILKDLSAKETINTCKKNFARFGVPCKVITDGATNFINQDFKNFSNDWKFSHITSSPHYPKSNGKAEVTVKIAKNLILKCFDSNEDIWYKAGFQYSYEYPSITPEANQNLQTLAPDVGEDNSNLSLSLPTRPKRNVGPPRWLSDYSS
ncbi:unnamed protein product [Euphydryas editha]|uniref:Integrase catalytic domain-containing protein n=1 Tax=Euphydryas editha TaxID=104508 RepID=A0AAU9UJS8_EUPED|nr:unnamed protein product [Euphydryas editha]